MDIYLSVNIAIGFCLVEGVDDRGMGWMDADILLSGRQRHGWKGNTLKSDQRDLYRIPSETS